MERTEWLEARKKGIGGSDIAAICGLSRWKSPMDVYLDKIGAGGEVEPNEAMYWGSAIEAVIRQRFAEDHPEFIVTTHDGLAQHPDYPFMVASYDCLCRDAETGQLVAGWEGKTASAYKRDEWSGESVPDEYWLQCQWYMNVSGLSRWFLSVLIGGNDYREFIVERDDETIEMLKSRAIEFWRLVETKTPPPIDGSEASSRVLDRLYPAQDAVLDPPYILEDAESLARAYIEAREALKGAQAVVDTIENELKALMASHAVGVAGDYEVIWKPRTRRVIDTKRLMAEKPDIAAEYATETQFRVFSVKPLKEER
jgi:putative phage-type endonuclease